jgi:hypothetical protein
VSEECCFCGLAASTRDHIPPRKLFPTPRPADLITVPACLPCNNLLSPEEEYFIHVLLSHREADTPVAERLRTQLFAKLRTERRLRMAHRMLASMGTAPEFGPEGQYLGLHSSFTVDRVQFDKVIDKIMRGLYMVEFGERVPRVRVSEVLLSPPAEVFENPVVAEIARYGGGRAVGDNAFAYRIAKASDIQGVALCLMLFFGTIAVVCTLLRPREADTEDKQLE